MEARAEALRSTTSGDENYRVSSTPGAWMDGWIPYTRIKGVHEQT